MLIIKSVKNVKGGNVNIATNYGIYKGQAGFFGLFFKKKSCH